jgi:deoxyhypusine synthase
VLPHLKSGEIQKLFPNVLAGREFRRLVAAIVDARKNRRHVVLMIGGHVIKTGVSPVIVQMLERGVVTAVAMNGAAAIHDVEIAMWGKTSEDVEEGLAKGVFGMTSETASFMNAAIWEGFERGKGMGASLAAALARAKAPHAGKSLLCTSYKRKVPVTVHASIGTDVIHQHPEASGQAIGETSMRDFRTFGFLIEKIKGGVVINVGSAVVLPEVFLKAIAVARSKGVKYWPVTTANLDAIQHYRPLRNVVERPVRVGRGSVGIALTGHHEIMIPLLAASVFHYLKK